VQKERPTKWREKKKRIRGKIKLRTPKDVDNLSPPSTHPNKRNW